VRARLAAEESLPGIVLCDRRQANARIIAESGVESSAVGGLVRKELQV
jgi:hypothetical protein